MITVELLRKHASRIAEAWLPHGFNKTLNYGGPASLAGEIKKPSSTVTIIPQHTKHSSKGTAFTVKQHERKIRGTGIISDPLVLDGDSRIKQLYQVKRKGANIQSAVDKSGSTVWVRARDKSEANVLADEYLANRKR